MSKLEHNLSQGNVVKQLIMFSLPFMASNLIQSIYNVADMIIVGRFSGTASISGVNIGGQLTFILTNFVFGLCTGGTVLVGQYLGANNKKAIKDTIGTLFSILLIASIVITAVMLIFQDALLNMIQTPAESFAEAKNYMCITAIGIVFIFGYNALSAIMRGLGDSKSPLKFVSIACVANVILDFVFVGGFKMGAMGAAIATVIAQAISMVLCIVHLVKNDFIFDFKIASFKFHKEQMRLLFKVGIPMSIQNVISGLSFLILTAIVNVVGGVTASAAVGAVGKFNSFGIMPAIAMSAAISAMAAQNIGAGEIGRAKTTFKVGTLISLVIGVIVFAISQLFPEQILKIFDSNPKMINDGITYMRGFSFDFLLVPFSFCLNGLFIAAGCSTFSLINNTLSAIVLRVPIALLFGVSLGMGLFGIGIGVPIASFGAILLGLWFYFSGRWQKVQLVKRELTTDVIEPKVEVEI